MIFIGPLVNALGIFVGGIAGTAIGDRISDRLNEIMMQALGLATIYIGINGALVGENVMICIISLIVGGIIGFFCDLEGKMNNLGSFMERKLGKIKILKKSGKFTEGFITATVVSCTGGMAIVGSISSGMNLDHSVMFSKAIMDMCIGLILATTLSIGVAFASLPLLLYEGALTLIASKIGSFLPQTTINEMACAGCVLIIAIGINILGIMKIKVADLLPAAFVPILLCTFM